MKLVKAWSGKWHIWEADLTSAPAIPKRVVTCDGVTTVWPPWRQNTILPRPIRTEPCEKTLPRSRWDTSPRRCFVCEAGGSEVLHPKPQPERQRALTICGEEVLVRKALEGTTTELVAKLFELSVPRRHFCSKCPIKRRLGL